MLELPKLRRHALHEFFLCLRVDPSSPLVVSVLHVFELLDLDELQLVYVDVAGKDILGHTLIRVTPRFPHTLCLLYGVRLTHAATFPV